VNRSEYSGIVTRFLAFVIDAAVVNVVALLTAAAVLLALSVLPGHQRFHALGVVIAGAAYVVWCIAYWAGFWTTTGQTPGDRVMHVQVTRPDGSRVHAVRAIGRVGATVLAALPLGAGFIPILLDDRRRGIHDWMADTVVTHAEAPVTVPAAAFAAATTPRQAAQ